MTWLFSFFQKSLFVRVAIILIATMVLIVSSIQFLLQSTLIFRAFPQLIEDTTEPAGDLVYLVESVEEPLVTTVIAAFSTRERTALILADFPEDANVPAVLEEQFSKGMRATHPELSMRETRFRMVRGHEIFEINKQQPENKLADLSALEITIQLEDGRVLALLMTPAAIFGPRGVWILLIIISVVSITSIVALHMIFRPLRALEVAATAIGVTSKEVSLDERGTEDVRRVARAINDMQTRIKTLLADRSRMLASLAHDIRTGLTHIKLRLDQLDDETAMPFQSDVEHLEHLISDMLLYSRAEQPISEPELVELNEFMRELLADLPVQIQATITDEPFWIAAEPRALKRAFSNLINNSLRYAGAVEICSKRTSRGLEVNFKDRGPGISETDLEHIFDPFYRVEQSRNRDTGGSGLGLTIAKALLSAQGAVLALANRKGGGLSAKVVVPLAFEVR